MPHHLNWDDFRLIRAISDTGSLGGAAERLGLNHSTVFRRLGALEEQLGVKLFERARVGYQPTPAGADMTDTAARMGADVFDFERRLAGSAPRPAGDLKVATNDGFATYVLPPLCAAFREKYPEIRLEMVVGNSASNLARREADVAIRAARKPTETLVGRRIAELPWAVYAAPTVLARWPSADGEDAPWIGYGEMMRVLPVVREMEDRVGFERIVYRTSTIVGQAEAAGAGLGYCLIPAFIGDVAPGLRRVTELRDVGGALWLLTHNDLRQSARVRVFMDFFGAELSKLKRRFEGVGPSSSP
jgi:DNA-binding transcriptional LysR family regulator